MSKIIWVCPHCGSIKMGEPGDHCSHCGASVIPTEMTPQDYLFKFSEEEREKWNSEMLEKYAPHRNKAAVNKREILEAEKELQKAYIPRCPTCGCPNIRETTRLEAAYNPASHHSKTAFKSFVCLNCGYAW